jgi:hypothetical protein
LAACAFPSRFSTSALQRLIDAGCDITERDEFGRNGLYLGVWASREPGTSYEFESLQYLLGVFDDVYATDHMGRTIFDRLDNFQHYDRRGSYQRDLWYCALERAGIDVSSHLAQHPRVLSYKMGKHHEYTPEHYHALKHLQSWDEDNFRLQMDHLLQEVPLDEDEALEMERLRRKKSKGDFDY